MKRGKFTISYDLLEDDMYLVQYIMRDVVVYHTDNNYATNEITYWAYHPAFDEIEHGSIIPEYECTFNSTKWRRK